MNNRFRNAHYAFEYFYQMIEANGQDFDNTKALFNIGFTLEKPYERSKTLDDGGIHHVTHGYGP